MHVGTVTHMAPELIERGDVSTKCDVYAFGIFMWECYTRLAPYKGLKPPQIVMGVVSEKLRPAFSASTPEGYRVRPCVQVYSAMLLYSFHPVSVLMWSMLLQQPAPIAVGHPDRRGVHSNTCAGSCKVVLVSRSTAAANLFTDREVPIALA